MCYLAYYYHVLHKIKLFYDILEPVLFVDPPKIDLLALPKAFVLPENNPVPDEPVLPNNPPVEVFVPNPPNPPKNHRKI